MNQNAESAQTFLLNLENRYEAFRKPLVLNSWRKAVGDSVEDVSVHAQAETAFFSDKSIDERLRLLAQSNDADISERAQGWLRLRNKSGMHEHASIAPLTERLLEAMAGPKTDPLHGQKALMTIYSSPDPKARHDAMKVIAERSRLALPILAERSAKLNELARSRGFKDFLHAKTGKDIAESTRELESMCRAQIASTQSGWDNLMRRTETKLSQGTDADWLAISTSWSAEAGAFIKSNELYNLSKSALGRMGFDLDAMNIKVRMTPNRPGGAAYSVSIPEDVRFRGHFMDGFEGARGWFHELGHAVHMKEVKAKRHPFRALPVDRALNEGIGEVFGAIVRDLDWVREQFPHLTPTEIANFKKAVDALDALAIRANCYHARLELSLFEGPLDPERVKRIHKDVYSKDSGYDPSYPLYLYLFHPLYVRDYVVSNEVTRLFLERLGARPLLSKAGGDYLRRALLVPGNRLTLEEFLQQD